MAWRCSGATNFELCMQLKSTIPFFRPVLKAYSSRAKIPVLFVRFKHNPSSFFLFNSLSFSLSLSRPFFLFIISLLLIVVVYQRTRSSRVRTSKLHFSLQTGSIFARRRSKSSRTRTARFATSSFTCLRHISMLQRWRCSISAKVSVRNRTRS